MVSVIRFLDTIKGDDLGQENGNLVVDFNFAYNPSFMDNYRWNCSLSQMENHLTVEMPSRGLRFQLNDKEG